MLWDTVHGVCQSRRLHLHSSGSAPYLLNGLLLPHSYLCSVAEALIALLVWERLALTDYSVLQAREEGRGTHRRFRIIFTPRKLSERHSRYVFLTAFNELPSSCWPSLMSPGPSAPLSAFVRRMRWEMELSMNGPLCVEQQWCYTGLQCVTVHCSHTSVEFVVCVCCSGSWGCFRPPTRDGVVMESSTERVP